MRDGYSAIMIVSGCVAFFIGGSLAGFVSLTILLLR
jgi:hypothetical protein